MVLALLSSCSIINDDMSDCPTCSNVLNLKFTYTYNLKKYDLAPEMVDHVTYCLFDSVGKRVLTRTIEKEALQRKDVNDVIQEIPVGHYKILAWGGLKDKRYKFPSGDYGVQYDPTLDDGKKPLGDLFFGSDEFYYIGETQKEIVDLMKDNNNVHVTLADVNGKPLNPDDYRVSILADNTKLDSCNNIVPGDPNLYVPVAATPKDDGTVVYDLSTLRIPEDGDYPLIIEKVTKGPDDQPEYELLDKRNLPDLLLKEKEKTYPDMPDQEYLDRKDDFDIEIGVVVPDPSDPDNVKINYIKVGPWVIRENNGNLKM